MIAVSHERVAWAWLDKVLDKFKRSPEEEPDAPVVKMTPRERANTIEASYDKVLAELKKWVKAEIPAMRRQEMQIAKRYGIDPLFFNWYIVNGLNWPQMSRRQNAALRAIQNIYIWHGAVPDNWQGMEIPELEQGRDRNAAMKALADWFLRTTVKGIERKYIREIHKEAQNLVKKFRGSRAPRDAKASIMFMRDFEKRLLADRFAEKPAIHEVVVLFT